MGEAFLDYKKGGSSGLDINGIIEDYYVYAGENISAGDFVEFVNGVAGQTTETSADTSIVESQNNGDATSACKLSEDRIFIAHSSDTDSARSNYLYGIVCTITGTKIKPGTDTKLSSTTYSGNAMSVVALSETSVFIAHSGDSKKYLYAMTCSINGNSISVDTTKQLLAVQYSGRYISAKPLPNGNIFVAHGYSDSNYLYGTIVTINGTTITLGADTKLSDMDGAAVRVSVNVFENGNICIVHPYKSDSQMATTTCSTVGTTITDIATKTIYASSYSGRCISTQVLESGNIFIAHGYGNTNRLSGMVLIIDNQKTARETGTRVELSTLNGTASNLDTVLLTNNRVLIGHCYDAYNYYLRGMIVSVDGTTITPSADTQMNGEYYSGQRIKMMSLGLNNSLVIHAHSNYYYLHAQIWGIDEENNIPTNEVVVPEYETQVRPATSLPCNGVASTSGEGGDSIGHKDIVSVYRPDPYSKFNLVVNGNFHNGLEGWTNQAPDYISMEVIQEQNENILKVTNTADGYDYIWGNVLSERIELITDHKYYLSGYVRGKSTNVETAAGLYFIMLHGAMDTVSVTISDWHFASIISTPLNDRNVVLRTPITTNNGSVVGNEVYFKNIKCFDLTEMFGAGNEPTKEWCDANL